MRFLIPTLVKGNYKTVFSGFDHGLLLKLTPPGMRLELVSADAPDKPGGRIHIKVKVLGLIRQEWVNEFSRYELRDDECHFVDEGRTMPFPFKRWRHDHRVLKEGDNAKIVDDVTYSSGLLILDWLLFPVVWFQFRYRRPIYRKHFGTVHH